MWDNGLKYNNELLVNHVLQEQIIWFLSSCRTCLWEREPPGDIDDIVLVLIWNICLNRSGQTTAIASTLTILCKSDLRYRNKKITLEHPLRHEKESFSQKVGSLGKKATCVERGRDRAIDWTEDIWMKNTHFKKYFFLERRLLLQGMATSSTLIASERNEHYKTAFRYFDFCYLLLSYGQLLNSEGRLLPQPLEEVFFNKTIHFTYGNTGIQSLSQVKQYHLQLSRTSWINMTSGQAAEDPKTTTNQTKKRETHFNQYFQKLLWNTVWGLSPRHLFSRSWVSCRCCPGFWCVFLALKKVCCTYLGSLTALACRMSCNVHLNGKINAQFGPGKSPRCTVLLYLCNA